MHCMRATDRRGSGLGESEILHLPLFHEIRHRADCLFDWRLLIDSVLVIQIDVLDAEASERFFARPPDVGRTSVQAVPRTIGRTDVAELGRYDEVIAPALYRATNELLVRERAIRVSRVEKGDAQLEGAVDRGERFDFVAARIEVGHAHAAEAEGRDGESLRTETTRLHVLRALRVVRNSGKRGIIEVAAISPTIERLAIRLVESGASADALHQIGISDRKTAKTDQIGELALERMFG